MSADKDRAIRRQKQKRAKEAKKCVTPQLPVPAAAATASPAKKRAAKAPAA